MVATATTTLLFCDLVGSTELHQRLGDAAADEVRRPFFAALRRSVAETGGIEVKNLGDGLMVAFASSAADAIACAISMQRGISEIIDPSTNTPIQLRVGISVGETSVEDDDWFGTPVNEAARLCSAAAPGSILVSDLVRSLVESRGVYWFRPAGRFSLKGLDRAVVAATVEWRDGEPAAPRPVKPPRRTTGRARGLLVGLVATAVLVAVVVVLVTRSTGSRPEAGAKTVAIERPKGYAPVLQQQACASRYSAADATATCSELIVPEDRAKPKGRQVHLTVVRLPARTDHPGEPTVLVGPLSRSPIDDPVRRHGDLLILTRRGAGQGSTPALTCPAIGEAYLRDYSMPAASLERIRDLSDAGDACRTNLTAQGVDLSMYTDLQAANDVHDLAYAMHLTSLDLSAATGSANLALRIAGDWPGLVRAVVVTTPTEPGGNPFAGSIPDAATSLDRVIRLCSKDTSCNAAFPRLRADIDAYRAALDASPRIVNVAGPPGAPNVDVRLDGDVLMTTLWYAMQNPTALALMPSTIASRNDQVIASYLVSVAQAMYTDPTFPWIGFSEMWCVDGALGLDGVQITAEANSTPGFDGLAPDFLLPVRGCDRANLQPRTQESLPSAGRVPTLVLATGLDPIFSSRRAAATARAFGSSATLVVFPTITGDPIVGTDPCVGDLVVGFLARPTAKLPAEACLKKVNPPPFSGT